MSAPDYPQGQFLFGTDRRARGRARRAADLTVRSLRDAGRLEAVDESVIVAQRCAADNVDAAERMLRSGDVSPYVVAGAIRTWANMTGALLARAGLVEADDGDELWRELTATGSELDVAP